MNLETICKIWRGGCIIRAILLEDFRQAFATESDLPNVMLDKHIAEKLNTTQSSIRTVFERHYSKWNSSFCMDERIILF